MSISQIRIQDDISSCRAAYQLIVCDDVQRHFATRDLGQKHCHSLDAHGFLILLNVRDGRLVKGRMRRVETDDGAVTRHTAIKLCAVSAAGTGRPLLATQPEFRDYAPAFDPEGKYLYFLSLRTYDPVYDAVQFELSFPRAARPYLIALQAGGPPPFEPAPKGMKAAAGADEPKETAAAALPPIDAVGLAQRIAAFPVAEGRFGQIAGVAGGKVVWTTLPIAGAHGRGGHKETPGTLEVFDFATATAKTLLPQADSFTLAADRHTLLVRTGHKLRAIDATKAPDDKAEPGDAKPSRKSGHIDLTRVRLAVEPAQEWAQMLREVWRLQRDHFWVEDMSGVDWHAMFRRYAPLLPRVATRGEFSDLVWELQGELCLLYTSDAADERSSVDLGGRRIIKTKRTTKDA